MVEYKIELIIKRGDEYLPTIKVSILDGDMDDEDLCLTTSLNGLAVDCLIASLQFDVEIEKIEVDENFWNCLKNDLEKYVNIL